MMRYHKVPERCSGISAACLNGSTDLIHLHDYDATHHTTEFYRYADSLQLPFTWLHFPLAHDEKLMQVFVRWSEHFMVKAACLVVCIITSELSIVSS